MTLSLGRLCFLVSLKHPLASIPGLPRPKAFPWHWPSPFHLSHASVSLFFQLLLPQQPLLLLSSGSQGRASPAQGGGCWSLPRSGCGVAHKGGGKLWSPWPFTGPTRTSLGTRNSWELLWELASRPGGRDRNVSGGAAGLQHLHAPIPAPCWDSQLGQWPWGQT